MTDQTADNEAVSLDYIMVSPSGRAFLLLDEMPAIDRRYFYLYRALPPSGRKQVEEFAKHLHRQAEGDRHG